MRQFFLCCFFFGYLLGVNIEPLTSDNEHSMNFTLSTAYKVLFLEGILSNIGHVIKRTPCMKNAILGNWLESGEQAHVLKTPSHLTFI